MSHKDIGLLREAVLRADAIPYGFYCFLEEESGKVLRDLRKDGDMEKLRKRAEQLDPMTRHQISVMDWDLFVELVQDERPGEFAVEVGLHEKYRSLIMEWADRECLDIKTYILITVIDDRGHMFSTGTLFPVQPLPDDRFFFLADLPTENRFTSGVNAAQLIRFYDFLCSAREDLPVVSEVYLSKFKKEGE